MANFKVGDEVMCVDAMPVEGCATYLVAGKKYKVARVSDGCVSVEGVAEFNPRRLYGQCLGCGISNYGLAHYWTWRFIKLDGLQETQDERTEQEA